MKRTTLAVAAAAVTFSAVLASGPSLAASKTPALPKLRGQSFTFAGFGGDLQKNQDEAWLKPFAAGTGVKIAQTDVGDLAAIKTQQDAKNVQWDVVEIESYVVDGNCGTVFAKVTINRKEINPAYNTNACGVPVVKFSYVLGYNSKKFAKAPASVADFFNTKDFPGKRAAANGAYGGLIETALQADGVAPAAMYPIDIERAFAKIKTIKGDITLKDKFAEIQEGLANGEFDIALLPNGRALNASKANPAIKATFVGAVTLYDNLAIPKGSKNLKAATAFLQYVARHSTQSALTERFPYGMGTIGATPKLDSAAAGFFPDNFTKDLLLQNATWWQANGSKVDQRWTETFAG